MYRKGRELLVLILIFAIILGMPIKSYATKKEIEENPLQEIFLALSSESTREDVQALVKEYGLYEDHRNSGTGRYVYRIAESKEVSRSFDPENGSVVTITFYALQNYAVTDITYFDMDRMIEVFWYPSGSESPSGYWLADYNDPSIVYTYTDEKGNPHEISRVPVDAAEDIVSYTPKMPEELNLLEKLFVSAYEGMTEKEIQDYIKENGLAYNSSGPGNEKTIGYSSDVTQKYGNDGSTITYAAKDGVVTRLYYTYYPTYYRENKVAVFFSASYASAQKMTPGFQINIFNGESTAFSDPEKLIASLHA